LLGMDVHAHQVATDRTTLALATASELEDIVVELDRALVDEERAYGLARGTALTAAAAATAAVLAAAAPPLLRRGCAGLAGGRRGCGALGRRWPRVADLRTPHEGALGCFG